MPDPACAGCLGDGKCWVCLGVGRIRRPVEFTVACHVCGGSGRCATCAAAPGSERSSEASERVVTVPAQPTLSYAAGLPVSG